MVRKGLTAKGLLISLGVAVATAGLGLVLLGIPGALVFTLFLPLASLFFNTNIHADAGWSIAILITLLWPLSFPLGYLAAWGLFQKRKRLFKWFILIAVILSWGLVLTLYCVWAAPKS